MITVIIGYSLDDNFMTPPMRVNAAVRDIAQLEISILISTAADG
jgi:hypothetical protein